MQGDVADSRYLCFFQSWLVWRILVGIDSFKIFQVRFPTQRTLCKERASFKVLKDIDTSQLACILTGREDTANTGFGSFWYVFLLYLCFVYCGILMGSESGKLKCNFTVSATVWFTVPLTIWKPCEVTCSQDGKTVDIPGPVPDLWGATWFMLCLGRLVPRDIVFCSDVSDSRIH